MYKNTKLYSVISYITWIGWVIALLLRDKEDPIVRRHVNQALILNIGATIGSAIGKMGGIFGTIGGVIGLICLVLTIMGIVRAFKLSEEPLPIIGEWELFN
ncbi:MAG: hypothetical protein IKX96_01520 [Firmicutes bacterium]|nr:hypothetical protein [Bacillota bacterium]